jgi:PTH1 family peptidyl-tRNA hydrolase
MAEMWIVAGLGNPGLNYKKTRHNVGFDAIDNLAKRLGIEVRQRKFGARFGSVDLEEKKLILLKPWQYMNCSGQAIATALGFYRLPLTHLLVIVDDMALEPGRIRLRASGSAGGHNGLSDIAGKLSTSEFARCRVGVGRLAGQDDVGYVLGRPSLEQRVVLDEAIDRACDAVLCWMDQGIDQAMTQFNAQ